MKTKEVSKVYYYVSMFLIVFLVLLAIKQESTIIGLKNERNDYIASETVLDPCPLCGGDAEIVPVHDSYYIKCNKCELKTDFFNSKAEVVNYWNNEDD